jgi:hypothetical protein
VSAHASHYRTCAEDRAAVERRQEAAAAAVAATRAGGEEVWDEKETHAVSWAVVREKAEEVAALVKTTEEEVQARVGEEAVSMARADAQVAYTYAYARAVANT